MIEYVADFEELNRTAHELLRERYMPGFDGMSAEGVILWLKINRNKIISLLSNGNYEPMPISTFSIAKRNGKPRRLGKVTAIDTVIQRTILKVINPKFEKNFSDFSYAYRTGRGVQSALEKFCELSHHHRYAAHIDISNCFGSINHEILREILFERTEDESLTKLILAFVKAPIIDDDALSESSIGLHQGSPLSPLLCNLYLDVLDKRLESNGFAFIRYADDIVLFGESVQSLKERIECINQFLSEKLKLSLNLSKTDIAFCADISFLGHTFRKDKFGILNISSGKDDSNINRVWTSTRMPKKLSSIELLRSGILRQKDYTAVFENEDTSVSIPLASVDAINVFSNVIFDTNFTRVALSNNVAINIFDSKTAEYEGSFIPATPLKSEKLIFEQLEAYHNAEKRMGLARDFVLASNHNIRLNIRYYNKREEKSLYTKALSDLYALDIKIKKCRDYDALLLLEAQSKTCYYSCFDAFISSSDFFFERRSKRPPKNEINAMISFGNTLLYNLVATEINKSALDIRIGFLHATNKRKNSLNLDIADVMKPLIVDRTVFTLINRRVIRPCDFTTFDNGAVYLTDAGKRTFISAFIDKMDTTFKLHDQVVDYHDIIHDEVAKLVRHFRNSEKYKAFRQVR